MTPETSAGDRVVSDPDVLNGTPVIRGTRLPVFLLVSEIFAADSLDDVLRAYSISPEDAQAALEYTGIRVGDINDPSTWVSEEK